MVTTARSNGVSSGRGRGVYTTIAFFTICNFTQAQPSPLHWASLCNSVSVLKCLRFHHADIYYEAPYGDDSQVCVIHYVWMFCDCALKQTKTALSLASSDEVKEALLSSRFASEVCYILLLSSYHFDILNAGS